MTERRLFILMDEAIRRRAMAAVAEAAIGSAVDLKPRGRSLSQNAAQWPYLDAFSKQLKWPVNGALETLSSDEWKDILSAAFFRDTMRLAKGLDGHVVMLGQRTSKFSKAQFSEWIEFLKATAADRGVTVYEDEGIPA